MLKKAFVMFMLMFVVIGFSNVAESCSGPNCMPETIVVNEGGSYMIQGDSVGFNGNAVIGVDKNWCGPSFGFINAGGAFTDGHGMIGGTNSFISLTPGKYHGVTVNGNTYGQGWAYGKDVTVSAGAWANDVNMDETTIHTVFKKNGCSVKHTKITDITHKHGYDFGSVAGGSLNGAGAFQGQAGVGFTKIDW